MRLPKWATSFGAQVIYGLIIGLVLGFIAAGMPDGNALAETLDWVGSTYVKLLKLLIPPLVFTAVVTSIANLRQVTNAARLAVQTLVWFAITSLFSVLIGIGVGALMKPGANTTVDAATAALYTSGEGQKIYDKWFTQKIPPKGLNLNSPAGPEMKKQFAKPSDSPDPDAYLVN